MFEGPWGVTEDYQTPNIITVRIGVRLRVIRFVVERETAQIIG